MRHSLVEQLLALLTKAFHELLRALLRELLKGLLNKRYSLLFHLIAAVVGNHFALSRQI